MDIASCSAVGRAPWESQEGIETKVSLRAPGLASGMGERLLWNRVLVWCLAGIDNEMLELGSNDLVLGSRPCPWSLTVALHISLNSGIEAALICLDSLKLSSCTRNPHFNAERHTDTLLSRTRLGDFMGHKVLGENSDDLRDTKEIHVPCKVHIFIAVVTTEQALRSLMLLERMVEVQGDNNCFNHLRDRDLSTIYASRCGPIDIYLDIASCSVVGRPLGESQEGLESKVGLRAVLWREARKYPTQLQLT
ncbi:hypothetical protein M9H77_17903 [Catharanthus roseus]|uniref:Uncharacterized protein n=1 Tax=Catharanthus roseus TaxID=4058 RepID=A0ACC0B5X3_CATRO|nr:hypothetical protein M9H77_17903 [Catharanthus roseus]